MKCQLGTLHFARVAPVFSVEMDQPELPKALARTHAALVPKPADLLLFCTHLVQGFPVHGLLFDRKYNPVLYGY